MINVTGCKSPRLEQWIVEKIYQHDDEGTFSSVVVQIVGANQISGTPRMLLPNHIASDYYASKV